MNNDCFQPFMTPMEVAKFFNKQSMIDLLKKYDRSHQKENGREAEVHLRAELAQMEKGKIQKQIMDKVEGKSEKEVKEMMSRGEVVANMWSEIKAHWPEDQQTVSFLLQELESASSQLAITEKQIAVLLQRKKEQEQQVDDIKQKLESSLASQQALDIVDTLAKAEIDGEKQLKNKIKEGQQEDTLLTLEDIGYFLNSLGMARNSRKLFELCKDDTDMSEMSIADAVVILTDHIPLSERLNIQFGIDMVSHKQYPPYQKHWRECAVCRSSPVDLIAEYGIKIKKEVLDKEQFSSFGLPFLHVSDLPSLLEENTSAEKVRALRAIKAMRENHTNHITT